MAIGKIPKASQRYQGSWRKRSAYTILTVGTDSNTGKMTTALMVHREMLRRGLKAALIGTGAA